LLAIFFLIVLPATMDRRKIREKYADRRKIEYSNHTIILNLKDDLENDKFILYWYIYSDNGTIFSNVKEYNRNIRVDSLFWHSISQSKRIINKSIIANDD
jgi:hypothetical protein